jgi:hypothetical protein
MPGGGESSSVAATPLSAAPSAPDSCFAGFRRVVFAHTFWISLALLLVGGLLVWLIAPDMFDQRVATSSGNLVGALVVWYFVLLAQVRLFLISQCLCLLLCDGS